MFSLDTLIARAQERHRRKPCHIVLSEGTDSRVVSGAEMAADAGLARITLLGPAGATIPGRGGISVIDPATDPRRDAWGESLFRHLCHKGTGREEARQAVMDPLCLAALMVRDGEADGTVGGAANTTAVTVRTALRVIGTAPGCCTVSGFFLLFSEEGAILFADCALVADPDESRLCDIAVSSARSWRALTGTAPRVAMLSFSTRGSAAHPRVEKVAEATRQARAQMPGCVIDGEIQFDAAFVPEICRRKAPDSPFCEERANVFVFPGLEAANAGYKIAERLGGMTAIGPVLQGLARPANDLSRGCSARDVFLCIAATVALSGAGDH